MKVNRKDIILCCSFAVYCIWTVLSVMRHEPCPDEYHVWRMVHDMSLSELWTAMSHEGHFILWHILQWPFVKWFGMDYHCIYFVSVPLMIISAWLLLFKLDFNVLGKLLILFSAPFCYYFPVVSRCYALIPPILLVLAFLYQKKSHPFLYCTFLGLLANTHAYMEGLVAVLWCLFVYNQVFVLYKVDSDAAKKNIFASLITISFVLFAFLQVVDGLIAVSQGINPPGCGVQTSEQWFSVFYEGYQFKSFFTINKYLSFIPQLDVLVTLTAWICIVIGVYELIHRSNLCGSQMVLIVFVGIAWQIFFACNIYGMENQRKDLLFFTVIFVMLIAYQPSNKSWSTMALIAFWLLNTSSKYVVIKDFYSSTSGDAGVAMQYESTMTEDAPFYTDYLTGVHDLMRRPFCYTQFDIYDTLKTEIAIKEFTKETGKCYLLIMAPLKVRGNQWEIDTLVALNNVEWGYHLYYIKDKYESNVK